MASDPERLQKLHEGLSIANDARRMATSALWSDTWRRLESELIERLLRCGPEDNEPRYRLQIAIETARRLRTTIEAAGSTIGALERDLDILEGRKERPIA
jgi:hypothetical protein